VGCSAAAPDGEYGIANLSALLVNAFCLTERLKSSVTLELRLSPPANAFIEDCVAGHVL